MFIVVTGKKGGISKTTTAVHLAAYFQGLGSTLLIDGDPNRSASTWAKRGSMPFEVVDEREGAYRSPTSRGLTLARGPTLDRDGRLNGRLIGDLILVVPVFLD